MSPILSHSVPLGFERSVAVVIGINAYSHGLQPLQNAVRDASALGDALERQGFEVLRLLDAEASLSALSHLVTQRLPTLEPALDRLLIYFAGHGLAHTDEQHNLSGYLLPADARRDEPSSYWPMDSLREALGRLSCRHLLLVLDCCFAGAFPRSASRDIRPPESLAPPLFIERFRHFTAHRSFQLLLSAAHDEFASDRLLSRHSQESQGDGSHSPFAHALLEALQYPSPADFNQDGLATASELYVSLRDRLIDSHSQQTPSLWHLDWHDRGEFLFLLSGSFPALPSAAPLSKDSNPYLGLRPFSSQQHHLFFGRERLVDSLLQRLRSNPLLLLCAPSGAGKSSLVHAGLLPRLGDSGSWMLPPPLRPSAQPLQALSSWLASLVPKAPSAEELTAQPHLAAGLLETFLSRHPERSLLLIVDPLEELMTACLDESLRLAFLRALSSLLHLSHPQLRLVLLLRSDFEPHFLALLQPAYFSAALWRESRLLVPPMNRDELRRCIEKPAESCVLFFSPGLVQRLLDDVEQMPGALPLLSVALSELFDAYIDSGRSDRTLSDEDYDRMGGGIAGALQRRADLIFHGQPPPAADGQPLLPPVPEAELPAYQRTLRNVLLRMVSPESSEPTRRRALRSELEYPQPEENARVQQALAVLEASRLVVAAQASGDIGPSVEPAHDALLSTWPRLHDWARHAQRELLLLRRISAAATDWERQSRAVDSLWADARLDKLELPPEGLHRNDPPLALATFSPGGKPAEPLAFNTTESAFLRASAARQRSLRRRRSALFLAVAVSLLSLTAVALVQANRAEANALESAANAQRADEKALEAEARKKEAEANAGRADEKALEAEERKKEAEANAAEARRQADLALSSARLVQAERLLEQDPTKALLVHRERNIRPEELGGARLQTALDISQQAISSAILDGHGYPVRSTLFSPDGSHVLTVSIGGTARLWRTDGRDSPIILDSQESQVIHAAISPDGSQALTGHTDGKARLWRVDGKERPTVLRGHRGPVRIVSFQPHGTQLLTGSDDGTARLWETEGTKPPRILEGHRGMLLSATFSPDGSRVLTVGSDGTARLWRTGDTSDPMVIEGQDNLVRTATFTPDGSLLLTAHADGLVQLWHVDGSGDTIALKGHQSPVRTMAFSHGGARMITLDTAGVARLWHTNGEGASLSLGDGGKVMATTFSVDGAFFLTALEDGTVHLWALDGTAPLRSFPGHAGAVVSAAFSTDGAYILTASDDGTARLWRTDGKEAPLALKGHTAGLTSAVFSPDGSRLATSSKDGSARLWRADGTGASSLAIYMRNVKIHAFSPNGRLVLTASDDGMARVWRADGTGAPVVLSGHTKGLTSATFSADSSRVLTASADGTARLWRVDGAGGPMIFKGHTAPVGSVSFSADGSRILTASDDSTVRIWHVSGKREPVVLAAHRAAIESATFSPDGSRVLTVSGDGTARLWSADGKGDSLMLVGHSGPVRHASFSQNGSRILTIAGDGTARVWKTHDLSTSVVLSAGSSSIESAEFSPDGSYVLTLSASGEAHLWSVDGKGAPLELEGHGKAVTVATFSPDSRYVLTASEDHTARLWRVGETSNSVALLSHEAPVRQVAFAQGGQQTLSILTVADDGVARLWHGGGKSPPVTLRHGGLSRALFLPGAAHVATLSSEGQLHLWPVRSDALQAYMRDATAACLSASERELYLLEPPAAARSGHARCMRSESSLR
jgi:WD40 repeat protein